MLSGPLAALATILASGGPSGPAAPPPPTPQDARAAVRRSLPYVEKVATAWMRERKCNSCHNVTFLVWSHNEAAARGFDVDRKKLGEWTKWSLADSLSDRFWFQLRPRALASLKADGVPDALLGKLKPLEGKTYVTRADYLRAVEEAVGREGLAAHQDRLVKAATLPNNGGGPDTLAQLLLGRAGSGADEGERESYAAVRALLLEWQEPDGSWRAQGQLPGLRWAGEAEMHEATTMWGVLALGAGDPTDKAAVRGRERALESLKTPAPGITVQSLALHLVVAHKLGEPARRDALLRELLGRQRADGGWGWAKDSKGSDAFATGQALYALGLPGRGGEDPAVRRAWGFLVRTQDEDGSWPVPQEAVNTRRRGLNVYTYWGTAWATIGLLQTLPTADQSQ
jgi:Squalene-hopene cyclase N-terminal domain